MDLAVRPGVMESAAILRDLARELGFLCIATHLAADALAAAQRFRVHAIILDMNLPDRPGLEVLNALKRNPGTRHIPVHVVSVADFSQQAMSLGAVGYALKPVKREQLMVAFEKLQTKLLQGVRRVLVVEDDERQRDSIYQLLSSEGVEISGVATATEALERLKQAHETPDHLPQQMAAFGIKGGVASLFATHPPLDVRIAALQNAGGAVQ